MEFPDGPFYETLGNLLGGAILSFAGILKADHVPGLVSLVLLLLLVASLVRLRWWSRARVRAMTRAARMVERASATEDATARFIDLDQTFGNWKARSSKAEKQIAEAWGEYRETTVTEDRDGDVVVRNALRPSLFFNLEDLGFGPGFWRIVPGLFVSIGLALTFLGLIAALQQTGQTLQGAGNDRGEVSRALQGLLTIASAKFIMSLTGLVCSIVFTIAYRRAMGQLDHALRMLCREIEEALSFVSLEDLGLQQIKAIRAQNDHMQKLNTELISALERPLQHDLPNAIASSIQKTMEPMLERVGQAGADGVGAMVQDLSKRFSSDIGGTLDAASARLAEAGERMGQVVERMDRTADGMGARVEAAVAGMVSASDDLRTGIARSADETSAALRSGTDEMLASMTKSLESIRENTAGQAEALGRAASDLTSAAEGFRAVLTDAASQAAQATADQMKQASAAAADQVGAVSDEVVSSLAASVEAITGAASGLAEKARRDLLDPIDRLAHRLDEIAGRIASSSTEMQRMSGSLGDAADRTQAATSDLGRAATSFRAAAEPVEQGAQKVSEAAASTAEAAQHAADAMRTGAAESIRQIEAILGTAREALGGERAAIAQTMGAIEGVTERFGGLADRHDEIDEKLGQAFAEYNDKVQKSLAEFAQHYTQVHEGFADSLMRLREVMEDLEEYTPESRRA